MFELFLCWQEGRISRQVSCQPQLAHKRISWSLSQLLDLQLACLLIHAGAGCFFFFFCHSLPPSWCIASCLVLMVLSSSKVDYVLITSQLCVLKIKSFNEYKLVTCCLRP